MRRILLLLVITALAVPVAYAQQAAEPRGDVSMPVYARVINYNDVDLVNVSVNGETLFDAFDAVPAFGNSPTFELPMGDVVVTVTTDDDAKFAAEIDVTSGQLYEIVLYEADDLALRAFEFGELLGQPLNLAAQSPWMAINLFSDVEAIDILHDGELVAEGVEFGEAVVTDAPLSFFIYTLINAETGEIIAEFDGGYGEPFYTSISIYDGNVANNAWFSAIFDHVYSDPIDYLREITRYDIRDTYDTFLELIELAGMTEEIRELTDAQLFAPDDNSLAEMGDDIPMDDPDALREFIEGYIVLDFNVSDIEPGQTISVETLAGTSITIQSTFNGIIVSNTPMYYNYDLTTESGELNLGILDSVSENLPPPDVDAAPDVLAVS